MRHEREARLLHVRQTRHASGRAVGPIALPPDARPCGPCPPDVTSWIVCPNGKVYVAAVRLERVVLTCELCRPWAEVRWTKDGEEVLESPALLLQKEDTVRRLVLPAVQLEDSGEYLCEINDESASFIVTVTGMGLPQLPGVTRGQC